MAAATPCPSYDTSRPIGALMDHLRDKGIGVAERAILFRDHMALCFVELGGTQDPHGLKDTPLAQFKREFSKRMQDLHWGVESNEDFSKYGKLSRSMNKAFEECAALVFGKDASMEATGTLLGRLLAQDVSESSMDLDAWISVASGFERADWNQIRDMDMDEDDLAMQMERKQAFHVQDTTLPKVRSLDKAQQILTEACRETHVPHLVMDVMTGTNPQELLSLAKDFRHAHAGFMEVGAPSLGLDRIMFHVAPYASGTSGVMAAGGPDVTQIDGLGLPRVGVSSRCGLSYKEVIIHEALHAHDALLGRVEQRLDIKKHRHLLSDQVETHAPGEQMSGLMKAWVNLLEGISEVQTRPVREADLVMAQAALGDRWKALGVDPQALNQVAQDWRNSTAADRDDGLAPAIKKLFEGTPFEPTADFRSQIIAAEIRILEKARTHKEFGNVTVFRQFMDQFDDMLSVEGARHYGKGYFQDTAERMARAMQNVLDVQDSPQENPYAKRWLVYADGQQSQAIAEHYKAFFKDPHVKQAYAFIENAPADMLTEQRRSRIQADSKDWFAPHAHPASRPAGP